MTALVEVQDLSVTFGRGAERVEAVRGISFTMGREKLGLVGESGSGKSTIGRALMRLTPPNAEVRATRLAFDGQDLLTLAPKALTRLRGRRIALIMQDPRFSLNPVRRIGDQVGEAYRLHTGATRADAKRRALEMLAAVQIRDPERTYDLYPHQVSGGMGQRAMIAAMLIAEPELVIADEPTSALDVSVRLEVLALLDQLVTERGLGLILISHDLPLVQAFCDRVLVLYAGRIVDTGPADALAAATHPYTQGLLGALPRVDHPVDRLTTMTRDPAWRDQPSRTD